MRGILKAGASLGLGMLLFVPCTSLGQATERSPVVTTPHFAFYSDFDTNLNDALNAAGVARKGGKPELFHSGSEVSCFDKLPPSDSAASAVDFRLPDELWHVVLFYTTGETVRRILNDGGKPGYTPILYEIFDRGTWVRYRSRSKHATGRFHPAKHGSYP